MDLFSGKCLYEDVEYEKLITYIFVEFWLTPLLGDIMLLWWPLNLMYLSPLWCSGKDLAWNSRGPRFESRVDFLSPLH